MSSPFTAATPDAIKVDIWSDIACPWCFIGKRKFEAAIATSGISVEVEYHSFELSPGTPAEFAGSHQEYLAGHLGVSVDRASAMVERASASPPGSGLPTTTPACRRRTPCSRTSSSTTRRPAASRGR